ncbi:site-specific integrase [Endozoicomonas sp. SESOKO1]|uniref:tyrosine-type recombinase/integrase n=1 Tax=Endozoicomonas sp. SESOKO1 TaxID=2828742 RepID=UPI002147FA7D|nr:site-specific integrase [Endozoicomonas sp. SESOKO1]
MKGLQSRADALVLEAKAMEEFKAGRDPSVTLKLRAGVQADDCTLADLLAATHRRKWYGQKSTTQYDNAVRMIEKLGGESVKASAVTQDKINYIIDFMRIEGRSDSTISRNMSAIRSLFKVGKDEGLTRHVPKLPHFKAYKGRVRYLSREEETRMLAFLKTQSQWHDFFIVMLDTGARNSELARCMPRDLNDFGLTFSETKGDTNRTVPLTKRARAVLERRCKENPYGRIFQFYNGSTLASLWMRLRSYMGTEIENDPLFIPYICRHTCASRLVQAGVDLRRVQTWLGHKRIETTLKYAHLAPDSLLTARDALETGA